MASQRSIYAVDQACIKTHRVCRNLKGSCLLPLDVRHRVLIGYIYPLIPLPVGFESRLYTQDFAHDRLSMQQPNPWTKRALHYTVNMSTPWAR